VRVGWNIFPKKLRFLMEIGKHVCKKGEK